jgi:hypothetical protein
MDGTGNQFLAGTAFTLNQHAGGAGLLQLPHLLQDGSNGGTFPDKATPEPPARGFLLGEERKAFIRLLSRLLRHVTRRFRALQSGNLCCQGAVFLLQSLQELRLVEVGPYTGQDFWGLKWLRNIIAATHLEASGNARGITLGGDKDDRDVLRCCLLFQDTAHLIPIHVWHQDVEQDEIGTSAGGNSEGRLAADGNENIIPFWLQACGYP